MKKIIIFLIAGVTACYCFTSMVLNDRIVNPVIAFGSKSVNIGKTEMLANADDFELLPENRLRSTTKNAYLEIWDIQNRIGELHSLTCKMKSVDVDMDTVIEAKLLYADKYQEFTEYRSVYATFKGNTAVVEIPYYAGPIDMLRLSFTNLGSGFVEIEEVFLNKNVRFYPPLYLFIYGLWCIIIFLNPSMRDIRQGSDSHSD